MQPITEPVLPGGEVTFSCYVTGANPEAVAYQWQYTTDGGEIRRNLGWATAKARILEAAAT